MGKVFQRSNIFSLKTLSSFLLLTVSSCSYFDRNNIVFPSYCLVEGFSPGHSVQTSGLNKSEASNLSRETSGNTNTNTLSSRMTSIFSSRGNKDGNVEKKGNRSGNTSQNDSLEKNVLGGKLEVCSTDPMTGFTRNGCCSTGPMDFGSHTVCSVVTEDFLLSQRSQGNDLMTPRPEYNFPGLKPGDRWCLCASRWDQARLQGIAPPVHLKATHEKALTKVKLEHLKMYAVDAIEDDKKDTNDAAEKNVIEEL